MQALIKENMEMLSSHNAFHESYFHNAFHKGFLKDSAFLQKCPLRRSAKSQPARSPGWRIRRVANQTGGEPGGQTPDCKKINVL